MSSSKDRDSENSHRSKKKSILPKVFGSRRSGKEEEDASNNMNNRGNHDDQGNNNEYFNSISS
ncbi:unnamed protein product, partial [Brassica oleracea]